MIIKGDTNGTGMGSINIDKEAEITSTLFDTKGSRDIEQMFDTISLRVVNANNESNGIILEVSSETMEFIEQVANVERDSNFKRIYIINNIRFEKILTKK